jgi:cell division ATPase FtsA
MEKENVAVGLDIGTTKIVAMIGKKNMVSWRFWESVNLKV